MINKTGENLDVVILTKTAEDWRTFACWYSVSKNLPDARVFILCNRTTRVEFQYFQWVKRLGLRHCYTNPFCNEPIGDRLANLDTAGLHGFNGGVTLLLDHSTMVVDTLDDSWLALLNDPDPRFIMDEHVAVARRVNTELLKSMMNTFMFTGKFDNLPVEVYGMCQEAKEEGDLRSIVSTNKGCGRWIHTMKGCPFSNADGLLADEMTVNELRVVALWRKMVALYYAVN